MRIGVLALQGGVAEHTQALSALGVQSVSVKSPSELAGLDGLIVPGGESTTISLLAQRTGLFEPIKELIDDGLPVLGTCAGMIMLADRVEDGRDDRPSFGGLDITVRRNAFGRQRESFEMPVAVIGLADGDFPGVFIRAPLVEQTADEVTVLARISVADDTKRIVAVQQNTLLAVAFHPELTNDLRIHEHFLRIVKGELPA